MKKYKPILFSTPMVQAILEGRKTQTRRIVKKKYSNTDLEFRTDKYGTALVEINKYEPPIKMPDGKTRRKLRFFEYSKPKYQVGDILWVRETWFSTRFDCLDLLKTGITNHLRYKADNNYDPKKDCVGRKWKPSIHMPREAARIFLKVVSVRAERLQDISEQDAFAEGVIKEHSPIPAGANWSDTLGKASLKAFQSIWKDIHGEKSWEENPFVWVYEFKRIEKPKDFNDNGK